MVDVASGESLSFRISVSPPEKWGMGSTPVFLIVLYRASSVRRGLSPSAWSSYACVSARKLYLFPFHTLGFQ